ncbi:MAG: hypothetical protein K0R61_4925 [Microvirga sp.]|nr:hypothetical protein [Microvirga sp.]
MRIAELSTSRIAVNGAEYPGTEGWVFFLRDRWSARGRINRRDDMKR